MTLEDALRFWRTEFVKTMDGEKVRISYRTTGETNSREDD